MSEATDSCDLAWNGRTTVAKSQPNVCNGGSWSIMYASAQSDFAWVHFGKSLLWAGVESLGFFLLVSVHGIAPTLAGAAMFATLIWNAVLDGVIGVAIARSWITQHTLRWMNYLAIPCAGLSFALLPFVLPGGEIVPIFLLFASRTAFSLIDVQHNFASAPLADAAGHLRTARLRALLATFAAAAVAFSAAPLIDASDQAMLSSAMLVSVVGILSCLCMIPLPRLLDRTANHVPAEFMNPFAVRPALIGYAAISAIGFAGVGAVPKALLQIDFGNGWESAAVLPILTIARLSANPASSLLVARGSILPALRMALLACGGSAMLLPLTGVSTALDVLMIASFGISAGAVALLSWARLTEVLAYTGGRSAPVGVFTMFVKFGLGTSALFAGYWLDDARGGTVSAGPASLLPLSFAVLVCCAIAALLLGATTTPSQRIGS